MFDIFVDASLGRRCGCAGVVFRAGVPLPPHVLSVSVPLPGGLTPNEGEMAALLAAARLYRETASSRPWLRASDALLTVHTDSATCFRLLSPQPAGRYPHSRFGRLAKCVEQAWTKLREDELCLGWSLRRVARAENPANEPATRGLTYWRKAF